MPASNHLALHSAARAGLLHYRLLATMADLYPERMASISEAVLPYKAVAAEHREQSEIHEIHVTTAVLLCWATGMGSEATRSLCASLVQWAKVLGISVQRYRVQEEQVIEGEGVWMLAVGVGIARFLAQAPEGDMAAYFREKAVAAVLNPTLHNSVTPAPQPPQFFEFMPELETEEQYLARVLDAHSEYARQKTLWIREHGYSEKEGMKPQHLHWLARYVVEGLDSVDLAVQEGTADESTIRRALFGRSGLARLLSTRQGNISEQ